jgi:Putative Actinobacterial Holin-X, holin superfamily III
VIVMSTHNEGADLRERPFGEVARDLTRDVSLLVRQEVELAKAEMTQKAVSRRLGWG